MDLSTTYLGMTLKNPLVPSASPLSQTVDGIRSMEDAGAAAVVMYSLFEEQLVEESQQLDHFLSYGTESFAEALSYYPEMEDFHTGPSDYLKLISQAKEAVDIPIIGSLNGVSSGGWVNYAADIEQAGADALELNIYYIPTSVDVSGAEVEEMYTNVVRDVKANVSIPVAVKLNPYFSATAHMVSQLAEAGASAFVLFNRFYQPDIDLETLEVVPRLVLSSSYEMHLPLRWVALLYGRVQADFAITSGVHTHIDVLKGLMAGANIIMMASALLQYGPSYLGQVLEKVESWMTEHEYESVAQMRGSMSQQHVAQPAAFERANYMKVLQSWRPDPSSTGFKK
jgi:dihydroorotate dehydrogenase (fumarate)